MQAAPSHNKFFSHTFSSGFFLIEVVVATAVIAVVLVALLGTISKSVEVSSLALQKTQASYLLEEGAEAVKIIRNGSWTTLSALSDGTTYYLSWSGSAWTLTTSPQTSGIFTRKIVFSSVNRDSNNDIAISGGTFDTGTRKVTVTVTWTSQSGAVTETLPFYVANITT